jgi:hypothetical protein
MRWQDLFADLEAQARALERADDGAEITERIRGEVARISLVNRLRAQLSRQVSLSVCGFGEVSGPLQRVGADWLLLEDESETIVPLAAVMSVANLPPEAISPEGVGVVSSSLRLTAVLRAVARDRSAVVVTRRDGRSFVGTPDRVGADFLDLALHDAATPPRRAEVRSRATISFDAIGCVRRRATGWG